MNDDMISRADFKEFVDAVMPVLHFSPDENSLRRFSIPVGPYSSATVEFRGPVSVECYDSLLAHIAFYKTLFPKDDGARPFSKADAEKLFKIAADTAFGKSQP